MEAQHQPACTPTRDLLGPTLADLKRYLGRHPFPHFQNAVAIETGQLAAKAVPSVGSGHLIQLRRDNRRSVLTRELQQHLEFVKNVCSRYNPQVRQDAVAFSLFREPSQQWPCWALSWPSTSCRNRSFLLVPPPDPFLRPAPDSTLGLFASWHFGAVQTTGGSPPSSSARC